MAMFILQARERSLNNSTGDTCPYILDSGDYGVILYPTVATKCSIAGFFRKSGITITHPGTNSNVCYLISWNCQLLYPCGHKSRLPQQGQKWSVADLGGSVRCMLNWWSGGCGFDPHRVWQHSVVEIAHEIFSTVILPLQPIQEGHLSVSGERCAQVLVNHLELGQLTSLTWP